MPKLTVSIDGVIVKEVQLTKERSTLGRRPYNDIVLDNIAVSGEHAAITLQKNGEVWIEDLGSTNGTFLDGQSIKREQFFPFNVVQIGKCELKLHGGADNNQAGGPCVRILSGASAGRTMVLTKAVTRVGKPGVLVASITCRPEGFDLAVIEGKHVPTINDVPLEGACTRLQSHDQIDLGGVRLEFIDD